MPRVLRIINRFNLGGPTYNAAYLSRYLGPEFETRLIGGNPLPDEASSGFILDGLGVKFEVIPEMGRSLNLLNDFRAFRKIRRIIREYRPDIVHTHAAKAGALGRLAARLEGVPVIVHTFHGHVFSGYFSQWKSKVAILTEHWLARRSTAIVVISEGQRKDIVEIFRIAPDQKVHIIPLGFDLERFNINREQKRKAFREKYAIPESVVAIGIIGRFAPVKNHQLFFDALAFLNKSFPSYKAVVIGDGEAKQHWINYSASLGLNNSNVVFTSWIEQIDDALAGLDIVVLTSVNEGTPVSLIEAQASARAVICTDVGGVRDCIIDGKTGLVVPTFNAADFGNAILELATNPTRRIEFGSAGKKFVSDKFSYTRLVKDVKSLYEELLRSTRRKEK